MSSTVHRATQIIELIAEGPRSTAQVAEHFQVHPSTIFRQLQTLERASFLIRYSDGTFAIGPRIIAIAQQALEKLDLRRIAHDAVRRLHEQTGHTLHLAQLIEGQVLYIDKVEDASGIRMYSRIGLPVRLNCTGVGKVVLAQLPPARRAELLADADWTRHTPATLGPDELDRELDRIAERGWGVDDGEHEEFVNCLAAPIADSTGTVVGALSITSIRMVADLGALREHLDRLLDTTRTISAALG
jgi:DNA-binding IclR family transcriptional regulator